MIASSRSPRICASNASWNSAAARSIELSGSTRQCYRDMIDAPVESRTQRLLRSLGRRTAFGVKGQVLAVQNYVLLSWHGLARSSRSRALREIVAQMTAWVTVPVHRRLTGMFTGMVLALQAAATLDVFGARPYVGRLVCVSMVRELGPVLTALMVTGRVGSGMAAELGSMVVTQQIDALRVLGTDPIRKLVAPRLAAGLLMVPILTVISDTLGIFGGGLISVFSLQLPGSNWRSVGQPSSQRPAMGLSKPVVSASSSLGGLLHGPHHTGGTQGVGLSTTRS